MSDIYATNIGGQAVIVPELTEALPAQLREGVARRRLVALGQACPCGAQPARLNRAQRREAEARRRKGLPAKTYRINVIHEDDCPATDDNLLQAAAAHGLTPKRWT